jgi:predicted flap endonuclease-1-like 5' DNA nuclease
MFSRRKQDVNLPGWLWFFLILPLGLLVALLYRQKRITQLPKLVRRLGALPFTPARRYTEPDSIPLEIRPEVLYTGAAETKFVNEVVAAEEMVSAKHAAGSPDTQDLKIIEGIGPKISDLLRNANIVTFDQLANTPLEQLDLILTNARLRHLADPGTWPEQARLAASGDWEELQRLQGTLKGGRRPRPA